MPNYNYINIIGHLGRDVDTRFTQTGKSISSFSVAVSEKYKDQKRTDWFDVKAWDLPEWLLGELNKGAAVHVVGKFRIDEYEKDGEKRKSYYILANQFGGIIPLGLKGGRGEGGGAQPDAATAPAGIISDDDVPF